MQHFSYSFNTQVFGFFSGGGVTFNKVAYKCAQVVGLLLLALTYLHHIRQILTDLLQHLATHLHLTLKEPEQRILVLCNDILNT